MHFSLWVSYVRLRFFRHTRISHNDPNFYFVSPIGVHIQNTELHWNKHKTKPRRGICCGTPGPYVTQIHLNVVFLVHLTAYIREILFLQIWYFDFGDLVYFPYVYQCYVCICARALITEARRRNWILWDCSYRCLWIRWVLGTNPGPLQEQKLPFTPEPSPQPQRLACFKINIKGKILPSAISKKQTIQIIWIFLLWRSRRLGSHGPKFKANNWALCKRP